MLETVTGGACGELDMSVPCGKDSVGTCEVGNGMIVWYGDINACDI